MLLQGGRNFLPLTALLLDDNRYSWTFISALFSSPFLSILIHGDKSNQKPNLASSNQARASAQTSWEVCLSRSPPRRLLSRLVAFVSSDPPPAPPGSGSRPTDRGPAEGGQRQRSNRRAVTGPTGGSGSAAGVEPGAAGTNCCLSGFGIARLPAPPREPTRCVEASSPAVRGFERV